MSDERQALINDDVEKAFAMLRDVPIPDRERVAAKRTWLLAQTSKYFKSSRTSNMGLWKTYRIRRPMMANLFLAMATIVTIFAGGSGIVHAADTAIPGDLLWDLDLEFEAIQLRLTDKAWNKTELLLSIAEERLVEAEELVGVENASNREAALTSYGTTVSTLAKTIAGKEGLDTEALTALVDTAVSGHETQLSQILGDGEEGVDENNPCVDDFTHPAAEGLAEKYEIDYETVFGWFCDGYGIGEIMLALE
ncbi:MAG: DUF5667 domain-containing protein, partial [Anaerolineae bacterium]|nr:DUF5667 domain-containing protein [Anaerolineae bacterium]